MHRIFTALIVALLLSSFATQADARRGGYSTTQELLFVSDTEFTEGNRPLALCHLVETKAVIIVNFWRSLEGYALATEGCQTDTYYSLTAADLKDAQTAGMIPRDIPTTPSLGLAALAEGFWGFGLLAALLGFGAVKMVQVQRRKSQRMAMMTSATPAAKAILDAMCHAAKADGFIDPSEVQMIKGAAEEMTGMHFALEDVKRMAQLAEPEVDLNGHKRLIKGRSREEQLDMMRGVLMVVAADGVLGGKEKTFVGGLAQAMGMDGQTVSALLQEVVGHSGGPAPVPA